MDVPSREQILRLPAGLDLLLLVEQEVYQRELRGNQAVVHKAGVTVSHQPSKSTSDPRVAWDMEELIAKRDLTQKYAAELREVIRLDKAAEVTDFELIHATPYQRARAAVLAVQAVERPA